MSVVFLVLSCSIRYDGITCSVQEEVKSSGMHTDKWIKTK